MGLELGFARCVSLVLAETKFAGLGEVEDEGLDPGASRGDAEDFGFGFGDAKGVGVGEGVAVGVESGVGVASGVGLGVGSGVGVGAICGVGVGDAVGGTFPFRRPNPPRNRNPINTTTAMTAAIIFLRNGHSTATGLRP